MRELEPEHGAGPAPGGTLRHRSLELLRIGIGVVWLLNLIFVFDPSNQFFGTFSSTALSFAPTSLGGPGVADFVAAHAVVFAWLIAIVTAYLAIAFITGFTTRFACLVGILFSVALLITQVGSTFSIPNGTDVGPHPLYVLIYVVLIVGGAGRALSIDHWIWTTHRARLPRLARFVASPER